MAKIKVIGDFDIVYRKFKKSVDGIISKARKIRFYEKPTKKRKRMKLAARKRQLKRLYKEKQVYQHKNSLFRRLKTKKVVNDNNTGEA